MILGRITNNIILMVWNITHTHIFPNLYSIYVNELEGIRSSVSALDCWSNLCFLTLGIYLFNEVIGYITILKWYNRLPLRTHKPNLLVLLPMWRVPGGMKPNLFALLPMWRVPGGMKPNLFALLPMWRVPGGMEQNELGAWENEHRFCW